MREILQVSSMDLKYYFESLFEGEKPTIQILSDVKNRRKID